MKNKILKNLSYILIFTIFLAILLVVFLVLHNYYGLTSFVNDLPFSTLPMAGLNFNPHVTDSLGASTNITQFNWTSDMDPSIGTISFDSNGQKVSMTGNNTNAGKIAVYMIPSNHQEQTFSFQYDINYGDSYLAAGALFRIKQEGDYLKGYFVSFNNTSRGEDWYSIPGTDAAVWKITYRLHDNTNNQVDKQLVKAINLPQSGFITLHSTQTALSIQAKNSQSDSGFVVNESIDISGNPDVGDGFGFASFHYSHNCERNGNFDLNNFAAVLVNIEPHNLVVDPNGGTWKNSESQTTLSGKNGEYTDVPIPVREGYTFLGWQKER